MTDTQSWTPTRCMEEGHKIYMVSQKADNMAVTAGKLLIEARDRIKGIMTFPEFLAKCCKGENGSATPALKKSRAYELIAIAGGTKTVEEVRARSTKSSQATRQRQQASHKAAKASAASGHAAPPPPPTDLGETVKEFRAKHSPKPTPAEAAPTTESQKELEQLKWAVDHRWPKMTTEDQKRFIDYVLAQTSVRRAA